MDFVIKSLSLKQCHHSDLISPSHLEQDLSIIKGSVQFIFVA